jgi:TolA-binding protein
MKHRTPLFMLLVAGLVGWLGAPLVAQNKVDPAAVSGASDAAGAGPALTLALNTVNEQLKRSDGRVDSQTNAISKGFADQKGQIDAIVSAQRILRESENESAVRVLQLNQENESAARRDSPAADAAERNPGAGAASRRCGGNADPAAAAPPPSAAGGGAIPASPTAYYQAAMNYFFGGQYDNAIAALTAAIQKYPESPEAAGAQMRIGESYVSLGGHDVEALAAFDLVIKNYKDPTSSRRVLQERRPARAHGPERRRRQGVAGPAQAIPDQHSPRTWRFRSSSGSGLSSRLTPAYTPARTRN